MRHPEFDAYTKDLSELITYSANDIGAFHLYSWEWVDNLHFMLPPSRLIEDEARRTQLEEGVRRRFREEAGWEGTGKLSLLWLPPFVFPFSSDVQPEGVIVWHVKQFEDGISYFLSPVALPFEYFVSQDACDGR